MKTVGDTAEPGRPVESAPALSLYWQEVWLRLTPRERLRRSWRMRARLRDLRAAHDQKFFPKP